MRSVFDVSADLLKVGSQNEVETVKLQKLAYYTFGWYGRLTGERLFEQSFYAMPYGPVVGDLLTLHRRMVMIDRDRIEEAREVRGDEYVKPDPYYTRVLEAVWDYYSPMSRWDLSDMTHEEPVWQQAWAKRQHSSRGDISHESIIDFFAKRCDVPRRLQAALPLPRVTMLDDEAWASLETLLASH